MRRLLTTFAAAWLLHSAPAGAEPAPATATTPVLPAPPAEPATPGATAPPAAQPLPDAVPVVPPSPPAPATVAAGAGTAMPPAPTPGAAPAPVPAAPAFDPMLDAVVHVAVERDSAWLEGRSRVDQGAWERLCATPCDRVVRVDGREFRVVAPGMTTSNPFVIGAGHGVAGLRVHDGSATARTLGIAGLAGGVPVAFAGMALFGLGSLNDEDGMKTAGVVTLAVGAVAVLASLPLLVAGSTTVKDAERRTIAGAPFAFQF